MTVPREVGCALKIQRPRHGVQGVRVRSTVVPKCLCAHCSLLSEYSEQESAIGRFGQAVGSGISKMAEGWKPWADQQWLLKRQPKCVSVEVQKQPVNFGLTQQVEVNEKQHYKSPLTSCTLLLYLCYFKLWRYLPKQQFFFYTCCINQKQEDQESNSLLYTSYIAVTLVLSFTCSDLLMQLLRKLEKKKKSSGFATCCFLLWAMSRPGCLTKNWKFTAMALHLFSVSLLSENPFVIKNLKLPNCIFWQGIMQNSLQQTLYLLQMIIFPLLFLSPFIPHIHHEFQMWIMTFFRATFSWRHNFNWKRNCVFRSDCFDLLENSMMDSNCGNVRSNEVSQCVQLAPFSSYW